MKKRIISMLLVLCMVFCPMPATAFAEVISNGIGTNNESGSGTVCPHTEHDDTCGYKEAVEGKDCTHLEEDGSYSCSPSEDEDEATPSNLSYVCGHKDDCGYIKAAEGKDCTHECKLCKLQPEEQPTITCDCTVKCTAADEENDMEEAIREDCPVCGASDFDFTDCRGEAEAMYAALSGEEIEVTDLTGLNNALKTSGGADIKLTADITGTAVIRSGNTFDYSIDLNGKTLDGGSNASAITHRGEGKLTIISTSGGKITSENEYGTEGTINLPESTGDMELNIKNGTVENTAENGVVIRTGGEEQEITITDGTVSGTNPIITISSTTLAVSGTAKVKATGAGMGISSTGNVHISGDAEVSSERGTAIFQQGSDNSSEVYVSNNAVVSSTGGSAIVGWGEQDKVIISDNAKVTGATPEGTISFPNINGKATYAPELEITGGTVSANGENNIAILNKSSGTVNISGGTISGDSEEGAICNQNTIIITGGNISSIKNVSGGTVKNSSGEDVYKVTFTEPAGETDKELLVTKPGSYNLTGSTAINSEWYVWLPLGTADVTYNGKNYSTTVKEDGQANFIISPASSNQVTSTMNFTGVTSSVKCTDSDVSDKIAGMVMHNHEGGTPCWAWNYKADGSTLTLNDLDLDMVTNENSSGIGLPNQTVTINWSGINNVNVRASRPNTYRTEGIGTASGSIILSGSYPGAVLNVSTSDWYSLFAMNGKITINEGTVNVTCGGNAAITAAYGTTINGGTVTAVSTGTSYAIGGQSTLNGGTITAKAEAGMRPFYMAPNVGARIRHDDKTGTWDNMTGESCTYKEAEIATYTVTFDANGGAVTPSGAVTGADGKLSALPTPTRSGSYRFDGWFTEAGGGTQVTPDTVFIKDGTIYARWTYTGSESVAVTEVTLNKTTMSLYSNISPMSDVLTATVTPDNASDKTVIWSSSNTSVASVAGGTVTAAGNGTAVITATTADGGHTAVCTVTVSVYSSGGGGSGSSSSVSKPRQEVATTGTSSILAAVDSSGTASAVISMQAINDAINSAKAEAGRQGMTAGEITAVINVNTGGKAADRVTVNLPAAVQEEAIRSRITNTVVVVDNPNIKIGMDLLAMTEISKQAQGDINLTATRLSSAGLTGAAGAAIGSRPAFDLSINYGGGGSVKSFGGGSVTVTIPYTLQNGEKAGNIHGVYVDGSGATQWITGSSYDAAAGVVRFGTNHFSTYGVGYRQDTPVLNDIANHPAKNDIEFAAARGLISGTSGTTFSPDAAMTRGELVTALGRMTGIDSSLFKTGSFTDVKEDSYYAPYVNWAVSAGITAGTSGNTFSPDQPVTRQEMAVFMQNYATARGYNVPKTREAVTYSDSASILTGAREAVKSMQMAGIIMGKEGNRFDPAGMATRAEVSAVLHRYVDLIIDKSTAQGFDVNDSGQWMYYQAGVPVKGFIQSNGKWYYMDSSGLMKSGGWQQISGKWYYFYADGSMAADTEVEGYFVGADGAGK